MQIKQETQQNSGHKAWVETKSRHCGTCGKARHNARTCQVVVSSTDEGGSD